MDKKAEYSYKKLITPNDLKSFGLGLVTGASAIGINKLYGDTNFVKPRQLDMEELPKEKMDFDITSENFATTINDDMSFASAFSQARTEVGSGGFFVWKDNVYSTFTYEEWSSLSDEDKTEFTESVLSFTHTYVDEESNSSDGSQSSQEILIEVEQDNVTSDQQEETDFTTDEVTNASEEGESDTIDYEQIIDKIIGAVDMNGDGDYDAFAMEETGDNNADLVGIDTDYDGTMDQYLFDTDKDGILDLMVMDSNQNGLDESDTFEETHEVIPMTDFEIIEDISLHDEMNVDAENIIDDMESDIEDDFLTEGL